MKIPTPTSPTTPYLIFAAAGLALLVTACLVVWSSRRHRGTTASERRGENVLTLVAAALATAVSSTGMWRFFGHSLHLYGSLRICLFAFIEVGMLAEALRARRNVRDPQIGSAGVDGIAVWALAASSGLFSAMDAGNLPGACFRLGAPLFAAWLWERGMAIERRKWGGRRIHWRITPERILVRLGIAEASSRTASEVDAHRRLARLARAAKHAKALKDAKAFKEWRQGLAARRLDRAMDHAVEHAGLAADPDRQRELIAQLGALYNASSLTELTPAAPWTIPVPDDIDAIRAQAHTDAQAAIAEAEAHRESEIAALRQEAEQLRAEISAVQETARITAEREAEQAELLSGAREHVEYTTQKARRQVDQALEQARRSEQAAAEAAARVQRAEAACQAATQAADQARRDLEYQRGAAERQLADLRGTAARAEQLAEAERAERTALAEEVALLRTQLRMEQQRMETLRREKEAAEAAVRTEREKTTVSRTGAVRTGVARTGGVRAGASRTGTGEVDRAAFVAEQTAEILAALRSGEDWKPDYDDLMERTGFKRSWCEKVVAEAKRRAAESALRHDGPDERTEQARTDGNGQPRTGQPRTEAPDERTEDGRTEQERTSEPGARMGAQERTAGRGEQSRTDEDEARTAQLAGAVS